MTEILAVLQASATWLILSLMYTVLTHTVQLANRMKGQNDRKQAEAVAF